MTATVSAVLTACDSDARLKVGMAPTSRSLKTREHILDTAQRIVGAKGFCAVGLNEILAAANIPKGSFYYYFESKDAFGKALLDNYFVKDLAQVNSFLSAPSRNARERLVAYWRFFRANQEGEDLEGKCLAVKLAAEVSDLSEEMRLALKIGTSATILQLARVLKDGRRDGSILFSGTPQAAAQTLYQLWMGASVMWKISRNRVAFSNADSATVRILSGEPV